MGGSLTVDAYAIDETTNYDLTVFVHDREQLEIEFKYNARVFEAGDVQRISGYFLRVLMQLINGDEINILSAEEKELLESFNQTAVEYPEDTIVSMFEQQVALTPSNIAVGN